MFVVILVFIGCGILTVHTTCRGIRETKEVQKVAHIRKIIEDNKNDFTK